MDMDKMMQEQHVGASKDNTNMKMKPPVREPIKRTVSNVSEKKAQKGDCPHRY